MAKELESLAEPHESPLHMTRKDWFTASGLLLLFWLLGGWVWRPVIEQALEERAKRELAELAGVEVEFLGQQAVLKGEVRWAEQRQRAETLVKTQIRATTAVSAGTGGGLNPVTHVVNEIEVNPFPPGWMLLVVDGVTAQLLGEVATPEESRDLAASIRKAWAGMDGTIDIDLRSRLELFDEAEAISLTLKTIPEPSRSNDVEVRFGVWAARVGDRWQRWSLNAVDEVMQRDGAELGMSPAVWEKSVKGVIRNLKVLKAQERSRQEEEARLAALPPPHVIAARAGEQLLLRGEFGSQASKTAFLEQVLESFGAIRVLDDLRVSATRRPQASVARLDPDEMPRGEVAGCVAGGAWETLGLDVEEKGATELADLEALDRAIQEDQAVVVGWLRGGHEGIPSLPAPLQPTFLTLAILDDRVFLAGQIAEEAHRSHLVQAVEKAYGLHREVDAEGLVVRGNCEPTTAVYHTALGLPEPLTTPIIAVAKPGELWKTSKVDELILIRRRLAGEGIPDDVPETLVTDALRPAFDSLAGNESLAEEAAVERD